MEPDLSSRMPMHAGSSWNCAAASARGLPPRVRRKSSVLRSGSRPALCPVTMTEIVWAFVSGTVGVGERLCASRLGEGWNSKTARRSCGKQKLPYCWLFIERLPRVPEHLTTEPSFRARNAERGGGLQKKLYKQ